MLGVGQKGVLFILEVGAKGVVFHARARGKKGRVSCYSKGQKGECFMMLQVRKGGDLFSKDVFYARSSCKRGCASC